MILFPNTIDNTYRGQWLALPLLALVVLSKLTMSFNAIFNTRMIIETADKIPLAQFNAKAVPLIIYMFQAWGVGHGLLALFAGLALIRYRALVPLATLLMLAEQLARKAIRFTAPLPPSDWTSLGFLVTQALLIAMVLGLILSVWPRARR